MQVEYLKPRTGEMSKQERSAAWAIAPLPPHAEVTPAAGSCLSLLSRQGQCHSLEPIRSTTTGPRPTAPRAWLSCGRVGKASWAKQREAPCRNTRLGKSFLFASPEGPMDPHGGRDGMVSSLSLSTSWRQGTTAPRTSKVLVPLGAQNARQESQSGHSASCGRR